jgi:hypothetical protein
MILDRTLRDLVAELQRTKATGAGHVTPDLRVSVHIGDAARESDAAHALMLACEELVEIVDCDRGFCDATERARRVIARARGQS